VHHLQSLKHISIRRQCIWTWRHQTANSRQLQRNLLCNGPVHHILECKDTDKFVVLHDQCSLPSISHRYRRLPDVRSGTHNHSLHLGQHSPQRRHAPAPSSGLRQQWTQQLSESSGLSAPNSSQTCLQCSIHVTATSTSSPLLHLLQLAYRLVQALRDIKQPDDVAPVKHRKVPEVVVDHRAQGIQSRVIHLNASRVRSHHLLNTATVVKVLRDDPPHDICVAHDTSKSALLPYNQSGVNPLGLHCFANVQDSVSYLGGQGLLRP